MGIFFNGRLWTSPATMSVVDDSAMYNKNLSVSNIVALIGPCTGGQPKAALRFGSAQEAREVLRSGDLLKAVEKAFDPSSQTYGPSEVVAIRVNPATQASLALLNSVAAPVINLVSTDYGIYTNQIKVKVEAGTSLGKKLSTWLGSAYFTEDNIGRNAFSVKYSGAQATSTMTIDGTSLILKAPAATTVATIDLNAYSTIQQLVDKIDSITDFDASVLDGNGAKPTLNALDYVTAQDVKTTTYSAVAHLQACVDWFNSIGEGYVTATRAASVGTLPADIGFTYMTGGADGSVPSNTDWSDCFTVLQSEDVQWVVPVTSSASIHPMASDHCTYMSNIARMERRCIVGGASGQAGSVGIAAALAAAKSLNNDRLSYVHMGFYDYDSNGKLALFEPYILAAQLAGMFSGVNPGTALTNKSIKVNGLEFKLRNPTDTDQLIKGGVLCVEDTPKGYKVVKSISTWLVNTNYNRVEVSTGVACDFVSRNVRNILDDLRGMKGTPALLGQAVSRVKSALDKLAEPEPMGPAVIVGDAENPPYKGVTASLEGDVLKVSFECSPVISVNYIPVVIYAVPYSGSASL